MHAHQSSKSKRRDFLKQVGGATAALASLNLTAATQATNTTPKDKKSSGVEVNEFAQLRIITHEADAKALELERARNVVSRDMADDTLPQPHSEENGRTRLRLPSEPIQVGYRLSVPGFGEVFCYADNKGQGYSKRSQITFAVEAAETRLRRVRELNEVAQKMGVPEDPEFERRLAAAAQPIPAQQGRKQIAVAYEALANSLHAGERLTLNMARYRISKFTKPRKEFLFGCLASEWRQSPEFQKLITKAFNFGVLGWYQWGENAEPVEQRIDYKRLDESLDWCLRNKLIPKGFGYVYLTPGAVPLWLRDWPYDKVRAEYLRVVEQTARRYAGRMPYTEVINEAHDKANLFHFSHAQILELTREACAATRRGDPTTKRIINHCCLWAEYAGKGIKADEGRRWTPYRYLKDCVSAGVEFETIGLQLYYPQQDLMEIDRTLNRFKDFNRPLQISELSCNSADGLDPASMRPRNIVPGWHGPWTEKIQADWLESIYTLIYSKPEFNAATWWNVGDFGGHFWPYGGLLYQDLQPKEAYFRLLELQQKWGVAKTASV